MHSIKFEKPVSVSVGDDEKLEVRSLMDMDRFLAKWPPSRRTSVYATAVRACEAARQGYLTTEQARRSFVEFAKIHDILWPDVDGFIAEKPRSSYSTHI